MCSEWIEVTQEKLQTILFHNIAELKLAWRGGETAFCMLHFLEEEGDNKGCLKDRIAYNSLTVKTAIQYVKCRAEVQL